MGKTVKISISAKKKHIQIIIVVHDLTESDVINEFLFLKKDMFRYYIVTNLFLSPF